ncbi:MAG: glutathione S-transferase family protein [Proteobacteria bacterium]|nr:glutathione S-transferase family protein [Pseudomonadota bacterium]
MYTLYYSPGSASLCVHWMLIDLKVPFELVLVDLASGANKAADYLALNPEGKVPTMMVDGRPMSESTAILMLLAERHPDAGLAPAEGAPGRPEYLQWMVYLANALMPSFRRWFYAEKGVPEHVDALKADAREWIEGVWNRVEMQLGDGRAFLLGEKISAADYLLTMLTRWSRNMEKPATQWPKLGAYIARMKQQPGLIEAHAREGLSEWISA